jgi:hypothetical protein
MSDTIIPKEVLAAIALGIYDEQNQHDLESNVLTITHESRPFLPWADKGNAMLQLPTRK